MELPTLEQENWIEYPDLVEEYSKRLELGGGKAIQVANREQLNAALAEIPVYAEAKERISLVPGVGESNVDFEAIEDPHDLETVDFALMSGYFGVAENAAVWVTDEGLKHRVLPFIVQHLGLVIPSSELVPHMHAAYERVNFSGTGFGVFIAGPSKTADIEQSLVIGAHGPRSLHVFLVDEL